MKYKKSRTIAKVGVNYVDDVVNSQGSVFRQVHQEDDFGIDGFIELVKAETVLGKLVAVQIKTGESYVAKNNREFEVSVDDRHLEYWRDFMVPVILVCYSPANKIAAWVSIRDYIEHKEYQGQIPINKITIPFYQVFNEESLDKEVTNLAHARADERILIRCADMCFSAESATRQQGFQILSQHPDSRDLKITCFLAKQFILDEDVEIAKEALFVLGYGVGRQRWSWNPNNKDEKEIISYATDLCSNLSEREIYRLIELVDDEYFNGPDGLGERCLDIIHCCFDAARTVLEEILEDENQTITRRGNAFYLLNADFILNSDEEEIEKYFEELSKNSKIAEIIDWMYKDKPKDEVDNKAE